MPRIAECLEMEQERINLTTKLLEWFQRKQEALKLARSRDRRKSLEGQIILAEKFRTVLPLRLRRLPIEARGIVTDLMPVSPPRPKVCLRCGGQLDGRGRCVSGRFIMQKVGGRYQDMRCQAVWRV